MSHANGTARRRILYVTHRTPYPPDKGDRIRNYHVLRHLSERAEVDLATLSDEPVTPATVGQLRHLCRRVSIHRTNPIGRASKALLHLLGGRSLTEGVFASAELARVLGQWLSDTTYDSVLLSSSGLWQYVQFSEFARQRVVVDLVDVDSQKWQDLAVGQSAPKRWLYGCEARRVRELERKACERAAACTVVSVAEARLLSTICPGARIRAIPNGVDLDYFRPRACTSGERLVFVGALNYEPNVHGMEWFCREVWPVLLASRPTVSLEIVGRRPNARIKRLAALSRVRIVADVPDVRSHLIRAAVVIAPMRVARGVQNKVLEALAMGKPTVVSPAVLEGILAQPERELLAADTPAQWVQQITRLFDDADERARLSEAGRAFVERHHDWTRNLSAFDRLLGLGPRAPGFSPSADARAEAEPALRS